MSLVLTEPKPVLFITVGETSIRHSVLYVEVALEGCLESTACHANKKICSLIMRDIWLKTMAIWQD